MMESSARMARRLAACILFLGSLTHPAAAQQSADSTSDPATHLMEMLEALTSTGQLVIEQRQIGAAKFMREFYGARRFKPAWTDPRNVDDLIAGIESAWSDGLTLEDFHLSAVTRLRSPEGLDAALIAGRDILFTDSLVRLGYQLFYGKVNPSSFDANWNLDRPLFERNPAEVLAETLGNNTIPALLDALRPQTAGYKKLRDALARKREASRQTRIPVPDGATLRKGDSGDRVTALRARLGLTAGTDFDDTLDAAVRVFQTDNRLAVDGVVGGQTLAALNVGPEQRIDTLRVNMERARWFRDLRQSGTFIAVNIAGFRVYLVENGAIVWETRAIVGKTYHKTPLFTADMQYIVLNPTWTPTANIVRNEMLPKIRKDPGYLTARNFAVYDGSGQRVDPHQADWSSHRQYRIVQLPGPENALGRVKFIFPNGHAVYLHDTPSRNLFDKGQRAFSHGCIRTENPIELAKRLLADQPAWQPEAIEAVLDSGKSKTVYLTDPLPVYLLYWTANPLREGEEIEYLPDVYDRDGTILKALDAPFEPIAS